MQNSEAVLKELESELRSRIQELPIIVELTFFRPPSASHNETPHVSPAAGANIQLHGLALASDQPINAPYLEHEEWIAGSIAGL
jgi:hypothetical protein